MRLEPTALEIFYGRVPSVHSTAETISDDDLTRINNYLRDQIEKSLKDKITYAVFHLLLQTEFRVNQICHLKCSSIVETLKPNEYAIRSINKTSHGEMVEVNITPKTHRVLKNIINETDELRNKTNSSTTDEYIFLYEEGIPTPRIKIYDNTDFRRAILKACSHLGIKNYTASNLRDTYMTKAWEYIVQNGRSDIELSLLTKHAQISTTVNHYLKLDFDDMLEATHEVEIGKINDDEENKTVNDILEATYAVELGKINVGAKNKIVVDIPAEFKSKESDVENGCGKCAAVKCNGNAVLSCLVCDKFFTTPRHEPFFRKAIDQINQQILCSNCRHEKDDLTTIKTLYTEYLKAICLHQERKNEK